MPQHRRTAGGGAGGGVMGAFKVPWTNPWLVGAVFAVVGAFLGLMLSLIPRESLLEWLNFPVPLWIVLALLAVALVPAIWGGIVVWRSKKARVHGDTSGGVVVYNYGLIGNMSMNNPSVDSQPEDTPRQEEE